jgi:hypothetical protein
MSNYCIISRHIAIISVNIYYEIQNEAGNQDNQDKFKKSFIEFIMSYILGAGVENLINDYINFKNKKM